MNVNEASGVDHPSTAVDVYRRTLTVFLIEFLEILDAVAAAFDGGAERILEQVDA